MNVCEVCGGNSDDAGYDTDGCGCLPCTECGGKRNMYYEHKCPSETAMMEKPSDVHDHPGGNCHVRCPAYEFSANVRITRTGHWTPPPNGVAGRGCNDVPPPGACCSNERRSMDGGCTNCGDPSL